MPTRLLAAALAAAAIGVIAVTSNGWLALLAVLLLLASMWRHFVPVDYRIGARGFTQSWFGRTNTIRWSQIRVVELRAHGVLLYPDTYFGPLRAMRGLYVPWREHRHEVLRLVDFYASTVVVRSPYSKPTTGPPAPTEEPPSDRQEPAEPKAVKDATHDTSFKVSSK